MSSSVTPGPLTSKIFHGINGTPAMPLLARAQFELIRDGYMVPSVAVHWEDNAIVAFNGPSPASQAVGVISFPRPWGGNLDIHISYVAPDYRRQGVYRFLWKALVWHASESDVQSITSNAHMENTPLRAAAKAAGRTEVGVVFRDLIEPVRISELIARSAR